MNSYEEDFPEQSTLEVGDESALACFVEVVVPLYVPGTYTYRVPKDMISMVSPGCRVLVQFGRKKVYAAIITEVHARVPKTHQAKYIIDLMDHEPVVTPLQLKLWSWISSYYMCHLGEVMSASMPGTFRLSSETMLTTFPSSTADLAMDTAEHLIVETLIEQDQVSMDDLVKIIGSESKTFKHVKSLISKQAIALHEVVKEKYRPLTRTYLQLSPAYQNETALQHLFDKLEKRAPKQLHVMMRLLELNRFGSEATIPVLKKELLEKSAVSEGVLKALIDKGVLEIVNYEVGRLHAGSAVEGLLIELSPGQEKAMDEVVQGLKDKSRVLLHGVTSSGKTEVYVELIKRYVEAGKQVLYLVPEIALTAQLIQRLEEHFGSQVTVYHSHHSQNERHEIWMNLLDPQLHDHRIIVGARSAIFLPFRDLGLVIVDEEHDSSFKQFDPAPRYQARDVAFVMGRLHQADILLGSATPSVESIQMYREGKMELVELKERYGGVMMPEILVADIKKETKRKTMSSHFSSLLMQHMEEALELGKQIILFQNRRGYNPLWQCSNCGWNTQCERCDVSLTYHKAVHQLKCHYCGSVHEPPIHCPACGSKELKMIGFGTEKIEMELARLLPKARVKRMDMDTTRGKNAHSKIILDFEQRNIDILVGTQMVTKGLDFVNVSVVGVLNADLMINRTDFRAYERAYQMMTQVAGRAGRDSEGARGKVIIQTMQPEHWVIQNVVEHTYKRLIDQEILERRNYHYPPFVRMIDIMVSHKKEELVDHVSSLLAEELRSFLGERVLGPQYPYISRIKDRFRKEMVVKIERDASITKVKNQIRKTIDTLLSQKDFRSVRVSIDVDPQ